MPKTKKQSKRVSSASTSTSTSKNPTGDSDPLCQPIIGVSKLKSQLRQAKRLLQKEGLSPELKKNTQLKIAQLQDSIENNPIKDQERRNAIKYHRIKFFDRKKVTRRLKKAINELRLLDSTDKQYEIKKQKLEVEVQQLRIDLNYVQHYPKHLKYVALFPGGEYKNHQQQLVKSPLLPNTDTNTKTNTAPVSIPSSKDPDSLRNYVRNFVLRSMDSGVLSKTPELIDQKDVNHDHDLLDPSSSAGLLSLENDDFFDTVMD